MKVKVLPVELTKDEIKGYEAKCVELAQTHKCSKVHYCVQLKRDGTNERVVSYIKEPSYQAKLALMSKVRPDNQFEVSDELRQLYLIQEASSPLTYGESSDCDPYKLGVVLKCVGLWDVYGEEHKKK